MIGKSRVYQDQPEPAYDLAIAALEQAAEAVPKSAMIYSSLGWAYRNKATALEYGSDGQKDTYKASEQHFRQALERNEKYYDALTGLGWVLQEQADISKDVADYDEAITTLMKSLEIRDNQPYARVALGWSYYGQQNYEEAEAAFKRATEEQSNYGYAYYGLGRAFEAQGKKDVARKAYQTAADNGSTLAQDALSKLK